MNFVDIMQTKYRTNKEARETTASDRGSTSRRSFNKFI